MNSVNCQICQKNFSSLKSLGSHVTQLHKVPKETYYLQFINSQIGECKQCGKRTRFINLNKGYSRCCSIKCGKLFDCSDPTYRNKISVATKKAMWNPEIRKKYLESRNYLLSNETRNLMSKKAKERFQNDDFRKKIFTEERNVKIAKAKRLYFQNHPEMKKRQGQNWKKWKLRDEVGWRKHLQLASKLGFEKIFGNNGETKLETKMYNFMASHNIKFEKQYELDWKFFDAYLPEYNILLEFDGEFWHKKSLDECQYGFQKTSYHNDIKKEEIARKHKIPLFRIRESESSERILELIGKK